MRNPPIPQYFDMTRTRFLLISLALVCSISLIGLLCTPTEYLLWIIEWRLPEAWQGWLSGKLNNVANPIAHQHPFLPMLLLLLATLSPSLPAIGRLLALGRRRAWGLLGLLPWLNGLFFTYLLVCADKPASKPLRAELFAIALLGPFALVSYYYLLIYPMWLAARS